MAGLILPGLIVLCLALFALTLLAGLARRFTTLRLTAAAVLRTGVFARRLAAVLVLGRFISARLLA